MDSSATSSPTIDVVVGVVNISHGIVDTRVVIKNIEIIANRKSLLDKCSIATNAFEKFKIK